MSSVYFTINITISIKELRFRKSPPRRMEIAKYKYWVELQFGSQTEVHVPSLITHMTIGTNIFKLQFPQIWEEIFILPQTVYVVYTCQIQCHACYLICRWHFKQGLAHSKAGLIIIVIAIILSQFFFPLLSVLPGLLPFKLQYINILITIQVL